MYSQRAIVVDLPIFYQNYWRQPCQSYKLDQQFMDKQLTCRKSKSRIEYCDKNLPGLYV